jgi:hypothetical protein
MVEPRPCCSFLRPVKFGDGPILPGITGWIGCQPADNPLATVKALPQKSSTRKGKTGINDPLRPKTPKNDVFYLKSENQNKTLLLNII